MKVKMLEYFQGRNQPMLGLGKEYDVSATLGAWLLEHRKAEQIEAPHYGGQPEPELRQDDELPVAEALEAEPEGLPEVPIYPAKAGKKGRK